MALATARIEWRANTANKTDDRLLGLIRDFLVGNGWTLMTDQSAVATNPYIVVKYSRSTGFTGDDPIAKISFITTAPTRIQVDTYESWSGTTGTNAASNPDTLSVKLNLADPFDLWVSCDSTFVLFAGVMRPAGAPTFGHVVGVSCIERLAGDTDTGTFYGLITSKVFDSSKSLFVPKLFNAALTTSAFYEVNNRLGGATNAGLSSTDEQGRHVLFNLNVSKASLGRLKGKLYGVATTTYDEALPYGAILPNKTTNPAWLVTKYVTDYNYSLLMQINPTVTVLS